MRIALYKGRKRLFNRLVSWWMRGPYSHCEAILSERDGISECASSSFLDGGVRIKRIRLNPDNWDIVETPWSADRSREWFESHLGAKYDLFGLVFFVLPWRQSRRRYFCSEAVLASAGINDAWRFDTNALAAIARSK